jgi:hypothetical protein
MKLSIRVTPSGAGRGVMSTRMSAENWSGFSLTACSPVIPPSEAPTHAIGSPTQAATASASSRYALIWWLPSGSHSESPWPRRSIESTRWPLAARTAAVPPHECPVCPPPCASTTGTPFPGHSSATMRNSFLPSIVTVFGPTFAPFTLGPTRAHVFRRRLAFLRRHRDSRRIPQRADACSRMLCPVRAREPSAGVPSWR